MDINGSKILVIGGAGFIGSFVVSELLKTKVGKIVIFDNFWSKNGVEKLVKSARKCSANDTLSKVRTC